MASPFPADLAPALLWKYFDQLRQIPRGSGNEAEARAWVLGWARERGYPSEVDGVGNVVVRVPGSPGREHQAPTVLQGHLDMVCEKNADVDFDFENDPIAVRLEGDWLVTEGTTLGADNGIGVVAAMAVADDPEAAHGPLELLLTVDEETGMTGAFGLEPGFVTGRRMLNLDTEESHAVYVGCAGGGDVDSRFVVEPVPCPEGTRVRLEVKGLAGGHSGLDIHENRANAIKCLGRALLALEEARIPYVLTRIDGGSKRNAIPREAGAGLCVLPGGEDRVSGVVAAMEEELRAEFGATDPGLQLTAEVRPGCQCASAMSPDFTRRMVRVLTSTPSSVQAMSRDVPGLVETSNNLGVVRTGEGVVEMVCCTRSSRASALEALRRSIQAIHVMAGGEVVLDPSYPGWQPELDAPLLKRSMAVHQDLFGRAPEIKAVHAGLECGLIGKAYPGMQMISLGPDIRGAHSPAERVDVPSVERFYAYLKAILAALD